MRKFLPAVLLLIAFQSLGQQNQGPTPAQTLRLARATYEQGRLHEIEGQLVTSGVINQMNKAEKVEAYKILCLSYIYLEEPEKSDEAMLNILRTDPYFEINKDIDPAEFVALYQTFRTDPIYRIGAKIGGNFTRPNVSELINTVSMAGDSKYTAMFGLQFGAAFDMPLVLFGSKKFTLHADLLYQQKRFEISINEDRSNTAVNTFTGIETQNSIGLPVLLEYALLKDSKSKSGKSKFNPYVSFGFSTDYLIGSSLKVDRQRPGQTSVPEKTEDVERQKINLSLLAAAGVKLPLSGGFVVIEIRYAHGLTNVSTSENAYANQNLVLDYGYSDSIFKLSSFSLTGSYIFNKFSPKKLTHRK